MITDFKDGIFSVDAGYLHDGAAAVYIVRAGGEAAVIETAHNASLPRLLSALRELGINKECVKYLCVTHVHLDHAGGAGSYMREFPNAALVVHPRGARHMTDPQKLIEGVKAVYGEDETKRLYGEILPVDAARVIAPEDGTELPLGDVSLRCLHTAGHAKHHMVFFISRLGALFSGDAFGISYEWMHRGEWAFPAAAPVQFEPDDARASIDAVLSLKPRSVFLTHFGELRFIEKAGAQLKADIEKYVEIATRSRGDKDSIKRALFDHYLDCAQRTGLQKDRAFIENALAIDTELNAQGLACWYAAKTARAS
ncbi:MAG: MBL fold metallo-hydrolase [Cloacibacillus sp.]